ncbi:MAG: M1 family metallopeptidase [Vicinamibacterales bacterium]
MRIALVLAASLLLTVAIQTKPDPDVGVPLTLAQARATRISDVHYQLTFTIPAARQTAIAGRETMTLRLRDSADPLVVDFSPEASGGILHGVEVNGARTDVRQVNGHVIVPAAALKAGENRLAFDFNAGSGPLNRSDDFLYTIFVPARAHEAFPCFDQPDIKARWTLMLDVPDGWQVLSNGAESGRQSVDGRTRVDFAETQPISTYLFAFAAGHFGIETAVRDGRTFRMFHRETDAAKVARNRDAIFDLEAASIKWLEAYTGIPYPFGKFDFLLVPAFQFGGMEHPGAIFYNASGLMLDQSATQDQLLGRASVIAHETSHMWFGDLVTMKWFSDVWMKEVFANYMAAKIVNPSFPNINHELRFLLAYYPSAYDVDRTAGTNEIRQPLENLNEAGTLYGAIIYQKAPVVMRQLETILGPDQFRDGLRDYLKKYSYGNASWPDLISLLAPRTKEDLKAWSHAWVDERGRPTIDTDVKIANGTIERLAFTQHDPMGNRGLVWNEQLQVAIGSGDSVKILPVKLDSVHVDVPAARGLPADYILPNGAGVGYGDVHLDPASLSWLMAHLANIGDRATASGPREGSEPAKRRVTEPAGGSGGAKPPGLNDELTRGSAWVTLWDEMLDGHVRPDEMLALELRALPNEPNEQIVQRLLGYLTQTYWRYTTPKARLAAAPHVEDVLKTGLAAAKTTSLKSAWFSAVRDTAQTPETLAWLTRVWSHEETVPGLPLSETDDIRLASELAVRGAPDANDIIQKQLDRTNNPDRKAQLAFVRPALSGDAQQRDAWFRSLADVNNRRHEPWVLEGLRYLNHPLRAAQSERYIEPSLELLWAVQRTGDVFFPKRWTDSALSGYQSPQAAAIVRSFLAKLPPDYPERLRRIVLSSADDLFRASQIR